MLHNWVNAENVAAALLPILEFLWMVLPFHVSQHPFVQHRQTWMLIVHTFSPCWCRPGSFAVCVLCMEGMEHLMLLENNWCLVAVSIAAVAWLEVWVVGFKFLLYNSSLLTVTISLTLCKQFYTLSIFILAF